MSAIDHAESFAGRSGEISGGLGEGMVKSAIESFDPHHGGFGSAPKFPHPSILDLLIDHCGRSGDEHTWELNFDGHRLQFAAFEVR